jgi:predicted lipoprotein with Yx(FWY)xxD motif
MRTKVITGIGVAALALAACGSSGSDGSSASADSPAPDTTAPADDEATAPVSESETGLGTVLVDAEGLTLYGLTDDTDGVSTCDDACADAWPPLTVDSAELPAGLDPNLFSVVERSDGSFQLKAGKWPLYRFAGDAAPGDTNGQGSGGVWFAVAPDGSLIRGSADAPASAADGAY